MGEERYGRPKCVYNYKEKVFSRIKILNIFVYISALILNIFLLIENEYFFSSSGLKKGINIGTILDQSCVMAVENWRNDFDE